MASTQKVIAALKAANWPVYQSQEHRRGWPVVESGAKVTKAAPQIVAVEYRAAATEASPDFLGHATIYQSLLESAGFRVKNLGNGFILVR